MNIAKKEATEIRNIVVYTANTGVPISKTYNDAEKLILKNLKKAYYHMYEGHNITDLITAWEHAGEQFPPTMVMGMPEWDWLSTMQKDVPVLIGVKSIFASSETGTWWIVYTVLEKNPVFFKCN